MHIQYVNIGSQHGFNNWLLIIQVEITSTNFHVFSIREKGGAGVIILLRKQVGGRLDQTIVDIASTKINMEVKEHTTISCKW